jgi:hypothetical protein
MNKEQNLLSIGIVVQRIFAFPFFAALAFIGAMSMWFKWIFNFAKYGGESIAYTDKMRRKTIQDIFMKLTEKDN